MVEHWFSDGEHYHFHYGFQQRSSWVTDVLGCELEIHYSQECRVIASRDVWGERYAKVFEDFGNMTGFTLPGGNHTDPAGRTQGQPSVLRQRPPAPVEPGRPGN